MEIGLTARPSSGRLEPWRVSGASTGRRAFLLAILPSPIATLAQSSQPYLATGGTGWIVSCIAARILE